MEGMMFEVGEAYEAMMGRWIRQLAPLFIDFVGVRDADKVLDVGCGTGSLTAILAKVTGASKIVGIDPSNGFIDYARRQFADPRVTFEVGDAQRLPYPMRLSTDAWRYARLITSRTRARPLWKCAVSPKKREYWQPQCGIVAVRMSWSTVFGTPR
jgi:SAM-dependent methyltransferase